jgi:hypothetical protein
MIINIGDTVIYLRPWMPDELPNPNGTGVVTAIHTSPRGYTYLEVTGRERLLCVERVVKVERKAEVAA